MRIEGLKSLDINSVDDWITAVDQPDLAPNYGLEIRGFKNFLDGIIGERDNGTRHLFATYPAKPSATTMLDFTYLKDNSSGLDYPIVAALDSSTWTHLYVNDPVNAIVGDTDNWIELSRVFTCFIKSISTTTVTIAVDAGGTIQGVLDQLGATYQVGPNELRYYTVRNLTKGTQATVVSSVASVASTTFATVTLNKDASATILGWAAADSLQFLRHSAEGTVSYVWANGATPHIRWNPIEAQKKVNLYYGSSAAVPVMNKPLHIIKRTSTAYFSGAPAAPTLDQKWHLEQGGGGLITDYQTDGSATSSATANVSTALTGTKFAHIEGRKSVTNLTVSGAFVPTITIAGHGYNTNDAVFLWQTAYNGAGAPINGSTFTITKIDDNSFTIPGTFAPGAYGAGGYGGRVSNSATHIASNDSLFSTEVAANNSVYLGAVIANVSEVSSITDNYYLNLTSTVSNPSTQTSAHTITKTITTVGDGNGNNWLKIFRYAIDVASTDSPTKTYYHSVVVTVEYDGYQESDTVYRLFYSAAADKWGSLLFQVAVNFEVMPKNITAITFYETKTTTADSTSGFANWIPANTDFKKIYSVAMTSAPTESLTWTNLTAIPSDATTDYFYRFSLLAFTQSYIEGKFNAAPNSLSTNLQHANQIVRSFYTPRYAAKTSRSGDSVIVIDRDDTTLLVSTLDGAGDTEDDNFTVATTDNAGRSQLIPLFSNGEMMGLQILNDIIVVFRRGEAETYDLQSGLRNIFPIDCVSKRSILLTPYGIVFAGQAGIYLMASDGSGVRILNPKWKNYYDGSYFLDGTTTSYITSEMRSGISAAGEKTGQGIISGYSPQYHLGLFHVTAVNKSGGTENLCYVINFEKDKWFIRQFNIGTNAAITAFATRIDNSFVIQYSAGLLNYPDTSSLPWEDDVTSAGASASKGIPCKLLINIGNLYNLIQNASVQGIIVDCDSTIKELAGSGTYVNGADQSRSLVGTATSFLTQCFIGGTITVGGQTQRRVVSIADDTHLTVSSDTIYTGWNGNVINQAFTSARPYSHNLDFFANDQTTSFDAKTQRLGMKSSPRKFAPIGALERLKIQIAAPSANLYYLQQYLIRKITLLYSESTRAGNN